MPRVSAIGLAPLERLLEQQRFTPRSALLKDIERAETLATELRSDTAYPEDWIVFRITGYRPDMHTPALVQGEALVADLSALVEHLCDAAQLTSADLPVGWVDAEALARRWGVSRRTVERYRRRGLIARRWRDDDKRVRLAFTPEVVSAFEATHAKRLARAGAFSRVDDDEAAAIRALAHDEVVSARGTSRAGLARALARRRGRSVAAVRRVLDDTAHSLDGVPLPAAGSSHAPAPIAAKIARAYAFGIAPGRIAERFGCTRATVHRIALRLRTERLQGLAGELPSTEDALAFDPEHPFVIHAPQQAWPPDSRMLIDELANDVPVEASVERAVVMAHRGLLERAGIVLRSLDAARPNRKLLDRAETDLRWALRLRGRALAWQRGLIVRTIESILGVSFRDLPPSRCTVVYGQATRAAIEAIARFDPRRGGRLAAPVSIAASRAIAGTGVARAPGPPPRPTARGVASLVDPGGWLAPWQGLIEPHPRLAEVLLRLSAGDGQLLGARYALPPAAPPTHPMTIAEVSAASGVTGARITGAWRRARRAIRAHLAK